MLLVTSDVAVPAAPGDEEKDEMQSSDFDYCPFEGHLGRVTPDTENEEDVEGSEDDTALEQKPASSSPTTVRYEVFVEYQSELKPVAETDEENADILTVLPHCEAGAVGTGRENLIYAESRSRDEQQQPMRQDDATSDSMPGVRVQPQRITAKHSKQTRLQCEVCESSMSDEELEYSTDLVGEDVVALPHQQALLHDTFAAGDSSSFGCLNVTQPLVFGADAESVFAHPDTVGPFVDDPHSDDSLPSFAAACALCRPTSPVPYLLDRQEEHRARHRHSHRQSHHHRQQQSHPAVPFTAEFPACAPPMAAGADGNRATAPSIAIVDEDDIVVVPEEVQRLPDGTVVRRRVVNTRLRKVVTRRIRSRGSDGCPVEYTVTEELPPDDPSSFAAPSTGAVGRASSTSPVAVARLRLLQQAAVGADGSSCLTATPHRRRRARSAGGGLSVDRAPPKQNAASPPPTPDIGTNPLPPVIVAGIYTDADQPGEPTIDTEEIATIRERLPDGRIVERRTVRTRQRRTVVKRIVLRSSPMPPPPRAQQATRDSEDDSDKDEQTNV